MNDEAALDMRLVKKECTRACRKCWPLATSEDAGSGYERLKNPNLLIRIIAWLMRPIIWEAVRQHPAIDSERWTGDPLASFWDALTNRNRYRGYGP